MLYLCIKSLDHAFDDSILAAVAVGPNARIPYIIDQFIVWSYIVIKSNPSS